MLEEPVMTDMVAGLIDSSKTRDIQRLAAQSLDKGGRQRRRRSRSRKHDPTHVPRPVNCFMLYRLEMQKYIRKCCPHANHREISKVVAKWWHDEPETVKDDFRGAADKAKSEHRTKYPDYKYMPKKKQAKHQPQVLQHRTVKQETPDASLELVGAYQLPASSTTELPWQHGGDETAALMTSLQPFYATAPPPSLPHAPSMDYAGTGSTTYLDTPAWESKPFQYGCDGTDIGGACAYTSWMSSAATAGAAGWCCSSAEMQSSILTHEPPLIHPWSHSFVAAAGPLLEPLAYPSGASVATANIV